MFQQSLQYPAVGTGLHLQTIYHQCNRPSLLMWGSRVGTGLWLPSHDMLRGCAGSLGKYFKGLLFSFPCEGKLVLVIRNLYLSVSSMNLFEDGASVQAKVSEWYQTQVCLLAPHKPKIKRQGLVERKADVVKMLAFRGDGRLLSERPPSPFLEYWEGFIGTQEEAEKRKEGVSHVTCQGGCLLGSGLFHDGYLEHVLGMIHMSSDRKSQSTIAAWLFVFACLNADSVSYKLVFCWSTRLKGFAYILGKAEQLNQKVRERNKEDKKIYK